MLTPHLISSMTNKQPLKSDSHPSLAGLLATVAWGVGQGRRGSGAGLIVRGAKGHSLQA